MTTTRHHAAAATLLLLLIACSAQAQQLERITICAYSLDGFTAGDRERAEAIGRLIETIDPEILSLLDIVDEPAYHYLRDSVLAPLGLVGFAEFDDAQQGYVAIAHDPNHFVRGTHAVRIENDDRDQLAALFMHRGSGDTIMIATVDGSDGVSEDDNAARRARGESVTSFLKARRFILTETDLFVAAGDLAVPSSTEPSVHAAIGNGGDRDNDDALLIDPRETLGMGISAVRSVDVDDSYAAHRHLVSRAVIDVADRSDRFLLSPGLAQRYLLGSYATVGADIEHRPIVLDIMMPINASIESSAWPIGTERESLD